MRCQERKGFLILKKCGNPATSRCEICGKQICNTHTKLIEEKIGETISKKILCLTCANQTAEGLRPAEAYKDTDVTSISAGDSFEGFGGGKSGGAGAGRSFAEGETRGSFSAGTEKYLGTGYIPFPIDERFTEEDYAVFEKGEKEVSSYEES